MLKYIGEYTSDFEKELNVPLMNKEADLPLVEYIKDVWRSLEIVKNIQILGFKWNDNEATIDINNHIFKREKKKRKKDRFDYKFINDDRCGCLTVTIQITVKETDAKNPDEPKIHQKRIVKQMLIPIQDDDGFFYIRGKKYYMIYQLVDKSTYTSNNAVTLKSLMPICVKRNGIKADEMERSETNGKDVSGIEYNIPVYNVFVFRKEIPILLFYLANGWDWAMSYLEVDNVIKLKKDLSDSNPEHYIYFQISNHCYVEVNREMFIKYPYVQSIVGGLLTISNSRTTIKDFHDKYVWIKALSNNNTVEKGEDILVFFNRLMDVTTRKILKLDDYEKNDIYAVLRWMMQNFGTLRLKDNMSLDNKRLRCNEYIASLLTLDFSSRLNSVITLGNKATMDNFTNMFRFTGEILIQKMHSSGILRFNDNMNDMDFFSKFKYTIKGPHSMGGKNSNNISIRYRGSHPSFLGNIDLLVCGNSDPGTSGVLTPFGKIKGFYFDESNETDAFRFEYAKDLEHVMAEEHYEYIKINCDTKEEYYALLNKLSEFNRGSFTVSGTSREKYEIIVENTEDMTQGNDNDDKESIDSEFDESKS